MKITVYFIRHGQSCANLLHSVSTLPWHILYRDPELTRLGREHSKQNGQRFRETLQRRKVKLDAILSSSMLRAMETAYYMFPNRRIQVVPYIIEKSVSLDNLPASVMEQKRQLKSKRIPLRTFRYAAQRIQERYTSNLNMFLVWLRTHLKSLCKPRQRHCHIAVVTHSHFMQQSLGLKRLPFNNEAYMQSFELIAKHSMKRTGKARRVSYNLNKQYKKNLCPQQCRKRIAAVCPISTYSKTRMNMTRRCVGRIARGTQCQRKVHAPRQYCYQHQN